MTIKHDIKIKTYQFNFLFNLNFKLNHIKIDSK
jgi:hypothetical protein